MAVIIAVSYTHLDVYKRQFYHSADILELKAIVPEIYIPFIADHFQKRKRHIEIENIEKVRCV